MRFNFYSIFDHKNVDLFSTNAGLVSASPLAFSEVSPAAQTGAFFTYSPARFSTDELAYFSSIFSQRNSYMFDYSARKKSLCGKSSSFYLGVYPLAKHSKEAVFNSASCFTNTPAILSKFATYSNKLQILYFRSEGFRAGSVLFKHISRRNLKFFKFFRILAFSKFLRNSNGFVFHNPKLNIFFTLKFFKLFKKFYLFRPLSFPFRLWFKKRAKRFKKLHLRRRRQSKSRFVAKKLGLFYAFGSLLQLRNPLLFAGSIFKDFSSFYQSESIYFNKSFVINKFGKKNYPFFRSFK